MTLNNCELPLVFMSRFYGGCTILAELVFCFFNNQRTSILIVLTRVDLREAMHAPVDQSPRSLSSSLNA